MKVLAVDPFGSVLAMPQTLNQHKEPHDVEGIGKDFIPRVITNSFIVYSTRECAVVRSSPPPERKLDSSAASLTTSERPVRSAPSRVCE